TTVPTINYRGGGDGTAPPNAPAGWNPSPSGTGHAFDAHFESLIKIPFTDKYTLFAGSDDGIQVLVDGVLLAPDNINADRGYTEDTESPVFNFTAGQYVRVEVNSNQGGGGWDITLAA